MSRPPILALKDARLRDGPVLLFDGVDLALEPRARACLVGRNGAGKSTLLRILAGEAEPDSGERTLTPSARIVRVAQEPLVQGGTLLDHATAGGAPAHRAEAEDRSPCAFCLRSSSSRYLRPSLRARRAVTPRSIHRVSRSIALSSRRAVSASACRILSDHSSKAAKPWSSRRTRRPANQKQVPVSRSRNARSWLTVRTAARDWRSRCSSASMARMSR